ncbi:MAG: aminotransferase class I/II-fold pyridoxal phosphate-dependent enzyme [Coriobacteriaceae bacterium]|nr:aminotransferase class I/II-fold pyridoxal phosphate-dependent enzyme [Coriobacteriaceae bacterium]
MEHQIFANRLREAMEKAQMKQVDLIRIAQAEGRKLGKSQISQYLSGKSIPRPDTLSFLARTLFVSEGWLSPGSQAGTEPSATQDAPTAREEGSAAVQDAPASEALPGNAQGDPLPERQPNPSEPAATPDTRPPKGTAMRELHKSSKLDNVLYDVRGPVVDEANRMEQMGTHVLKLNIGNPAPFGFRAVDEMVLDMSRQLADCEGYSDSHGLFSARKAIMQYSQIKGLPNVSMEGIYTGNGVSELINMCMQALCDNGDEVLIPSPDYPLWTACVTLAGGTPVHYTCDEQADWYPDIDDIRSKVTPRTKAIVIINPNNPTGALYPKEVLQEIVEVAREHGLMIFSDEIYDRLVMDGLEHVSIASLCPDLFCITFSGLSKSHMIAGWRIGWMVLSGNKRIAKSYIEGLDMLSNMRLCSNVPAQSVVQTALWGNQSVKDYVVPGGRVFEQRNYVYDALNSIDGISVVKPKAAFYCFPKIDTKKFNITDDVQFALDLLREKKLLIVQGTGFNWKEPDHFRVVFLPRIEVLSEAMEKLEDFLRYYHQ